MKKQMLAILISLIIALAALPAYTYASAALRWQPRGNNDMAVVTAAA